MTDPNSYPDGPATQPTQPMGPAQPPAPPVPQAWAAEGAPAAPPPPGPPPGTPGYGPAPGYDPAASFPPSPSAAPFGSSSSGPGLELWLGLASVALVLLAVFVEEHDSNLWDGSVVWSLFAIAAAVATLAPALGRQIGLSESTAWTVGAIGAGGLVAWWVLLVLPGIADNIGFVATAGVAAGAAAVWRAPGRPDPSSSSGPTTW